MRALALASVAMLAVMLAACDPPASPLGATEVVNDLENCEVEFRLFSSPDPAGGDRVSSAALINRQTSGVWLFDATAEIEDQLALIRAPEGEGGTTPAPRLGGIFLTGSEPDRISGLMSLRGDNGDGGDDDGGDDVQGVDVHAMPRTARTLREEGPWSRLVKSRAVRLRPLQDERAVVLPRGMSVAPVRLSETDDTVAYRIAMPGRRNVVYTPQASQPTGLDADLVFTRGMDMGSERHCLMEAVERMDGGTLEPETGEPG